MMLEHHRQALMLCRWYPPTSGAAGIRARRVVGALQRLGLSVAIVCQGERASSGQGLAGETIIRLGPDGQIPAGCPDGGLSRWRTWPPIPGPDYEPTFYRAAYRACLGWLAEHSTSMLYASAPPFGVLAVARQVAEQTGTPLVLEFRDAWFTGMYWPYPNALRRWAAGQWERRCVRSAAKIVTATEQMRRCLLDAYGQSLAERVLTIRHGYGIGQNEQTPPDPAGFLTHPFLGDDVFTIAYTGQLRGVDIVAGPRWRRVLSGLNQTARRALLGARFCERLRLDWMSPHDLLAVLAEMGQADPAFKQRCRVVFVGQCFEQIDHWTRQHGLQGNVHQFGAVSPELAQAIAQRADLLWLNLYGIKGLDYHWCVPSKLYSYLGSGKPILAVLPPGETADIVQRARAGWVVPPEKPNALRDALTQAFDAHRQARPPFAPDWDYIRDFSADVQQERLARFLADVVPKAATQVRSRKGQGDCRLQATGLQKTVPNGIR